MLPLEKINRKKMQSPDGSRALFMYATEGILITNSLGTITTINPAAEKMFGYEAGELIGKKIEVLIPNRFTKKHETHRDNFNHKPKPRNMGAGLNLFGKRKDGSEFPVEVSLSPYSNQEEKFVIGFIVDITQRKIAENKLNNYAGDLERQVGNRTMILKEAVAELEKTKEELNEALKKEKELNTLKSRFVSMASHEFRTPLATILSSLSLVTKYGEQNEKEKQTKHISRIKTSVNNLTDILNDMLSISKLEEGKASISPEKFQINEFVGETIRELQMLTQTGQVINYCHSGNETTIMFDKKIFRQILFNLISNAIKFSPEGKNIEVTTNISDSSVELSVKDSGIGISDEDQKHLFERFFRGQNAANIQGTGLGLNIVAKYVEMLQGEINLKSKLGEGTTFIIKFSK